MVSSEREQKFTFQWKKTRKATQNWLAAPKTPLTDFGLGDPPYQVSVESSI
ncbi:hypothetical protein FRX31_013277, partial [Thalictrum thalictroides]